MTTRLGYGLFGPERIDLSRPMDLMYHNSKIQGVPLRYVEALSDASTKLADFFNILRDPARRDLTAVDRPPSLRAIKEQTMGSEGGSSSDGKAKQMLWIVPTSLLVLLVAYTLYTGHTIEEIGLGGIGSVKFRNPNGGPVLPPATSSLHADQGTDTLVPPEAAQKMDQGEMARRQAELEAKLRRMEEALKRSEARPVRRAAQEDETDVPAARVPRHVNIAGTWRDRSGVSWVIQQTGNAVTFQEFNPILGVTAVGQGTLSGHALQLSYQSALQTNGQAELTISPDGRNLTGNARDDVTGVSFPLTFNR